MDHARPTTFSVNMYTVVQEKFTAYNGKQLTLSYRQDTNDYNTIVSILENDEYKTSQMSYAPGDTFIDIGSHIGAWSALMEKLVPDAKVIAVEPLPENTVLIRKNTNATVIQKAVANRDGVKTKIYYADNSISGLHHKFVGNINEWKGEKFYEADSFSLKTLLKDIPRVRVLKIDCEGAEHSFFRFASRETLSKIDYIIGEYHNFNPTIQSKTRESLFNSTKGLFEDITENKKEKVNGPFWFKKKI